MASVERTPRSLSAREPPPISSSPRRLNDETLLEAEQIGVERELTWNAKRQGDICAILKNAKVNAPGGDASSGAASDNELSDAPSHAGQLVLRKMANDVRAEYDKVANAYAFLPDLFGGPKDRFGVIRTLFVEWDNLELQLRAAILRRSEVSELLLEHTRAREKDTALLQREKLQMMQEITWYLQRRDAIRLSLTQFLSALEHDFNDLCSFEVDPGRMVTIPSPKNGDNRETKNAFLHRELSELYQEVRALEARLQQVTDFILLPSDDLKGPDLAVLKREKVTLTNLINESKARMDELQGFLGWGENGAGVRAIVQDIAARVAECRDEVANWSEVEIDREVAANQERVKKIIAQRKQRNSSPEFPSALRIEFSELKMEALQLEKRRVDLMCLRAKDDPASRILSLQRTLLNTKAELNNLRALSMNNESSPVREWSELDAAMERLAFRAQYCEQNLESVGATPLEPESEVEIKIGDLQKQLLKVEERFTAAPAVPEQLSGVEAVMIQMENRIKLEGDNASATSSPTAKPAMPIPGLGEDLDKVFIRNFFN